MVSKTKQETEEERNHSNRKLKQEATRVTEIIG